MSTAARAIHRRDTEKLNDGTAEETAVADAIAEL